MKIVRFLFALCLICGFAVPDAQSQAIVLKGETFTMGSYDSNESQVVITPSGNMMVRMTFQLDVTDPLVPPKGSCEITAVLFFFFNGFYNLEGTVIITSEGKATATFRLNG